MNESRGIALAQALIDLWRRAGISIRRGVDPAAIWAFERKYSVAMPADMRGYFLTVDGMEDELDPGTNRFWPLAMVKPVEEELTTTHPDQRAYPSCFIFADHCIWCLAWAVKLQKEPASKSGPVFQVTGGDPPGREIAESFSDFLGMYLEEQYSVL